MKIHIIGDPECAAVKMVSAACIEAGFEISVHEDCQVAIAPYLTKKLERELSYPTIGTLIFHPSLLPTRRGGDSIKWSYRYGDNVTGVTWFWAGEGYDTGDICSQEAFPLNKAITPRDHYDKLVLPAMVRSLNVALSEFKLGYFRRVKQVEEHSTFDFKITK